MAIKTYFNQIDSQKSVKQMEQMSLTAYGNGIYILNQSNWYYQKKHTLFYFPTTQDSHHTRKVIIGPILIAFKLCLVAVYAQTTAALNVEYDRYFTSLATTIATLDYLRGESLLAWEMMKEKYKTVQITSANNNNNNHVQNWNNWN